MSLKDKKKCVRAVILVTVSILLGIWFRFGHAENSGFYQNGKAGLVTEEKDLNGKSGLKEKKDLEDSEKEKDSEKKKGSDDKNSEKKERVIVKDTDYSAIDNTLYGWWFKRNDNHERSGCQEDFDITEYNAYYTVPANEKIIYFTFDCGYENGFTPDMLDVLKEEEVPAAFFVTQTFIRDNIELTKRMKEDGHLVCNHTVKHPSMPGKSVEEQKNEILTCETYMKEATGYEMDLFFRPPRGEYSKRTLQIAKDLGYKTIFWSMAYLDFDIKNQPTSSHVVEHFKKYYHPGAIPLMHNISQANHDALKQVIRDLKKEGYTFGNLHDLP